MTTPIRVSVGIAAIVFMGSGALWYCGGDLDNPSSATATPAETQVTATPPSASALTAVAVPVETDAAAAKIPYRMGPSAPKAPEPCVSCPPESTTLPGSNQMR